MKIDMSEGMHLVFSFVDHRAGATCSSHGCCVYPYPSCFLEDSGAAALVSGAVLGM